MPLFTPELEFSDDYPTIEPSLKLDFANARALDPRITFTRASTATYVGRDGLIKTAGEDEARFDHDPTTGESLGLLIEESRTNLLSYSDLTSGASGSWWVNGGPTVSQGSNVTAPDGTLTAWNTVYNGAFGDGNLYRGGGEVTTTNSTSYTISVWAKANPSNTYVAGIAIRTFNNDHRVNFNLLTGSYISSTEGSPTSYSIIPYPNGWYRCSMTFTSGTDGNQGVQFYLITSTGSTALNSAGANGEEIYMWGAQMEAGSFPTSYIPTSGSPATRGQEKALISGESFNSFFNSTEGFIMGTYKLNGVNTGTDWQTLVTIDNKTASNRMWIYARGGGDITQWIGSSGGATQFTPALGANATAGVERTVGGAYALNDMIGVYEGTLTAPDTNALLPVGVDRMGIGYRDDTSSAFMNGTIKKLFYYPKRLTNTQLQTLTQ